VSGDFLDEDHQRIAEFADAYLDEDEREGFVDGLLERRGYVKVSQWAPPEPQQAAGGGKKPLIKPKQQQRGSGQQGGASGYFRGSR
jgi:hypothetical protein